MFRICSSLDSVNIFLSYITGLHAYIISFARKTQPLVDVAGQQRADEQEFEALWAEGKVPGWEDVSRSKSNGDHPAEGEGIWCSACAYFKSRALSFWLMIR